MENDHPTKTIFSPKYNRFLRLLKQARKNAGLTQAETAECLGHRQSFVSKCESGERRVDVVELLAFCRVYGIDPCNLIRELEND